MKKIWRLAAAWVLILAAGSTAWADGKIATVRPDGQPNQAAWMAEGTFGIMTHYLVRPQGNTLEEKTAADYGVDVAPRLSIVKTVEPAGRKAGVKVGSVDELIAKLKDEAGVL